jgi:isoamylase
VIQPVPVPMTLPGSCRQDPVLSQVKLIAEPWDCGPGGYQVGSFPPGWAEWNDRYRDTVRGFWKGDEAKAAEMASRLAASAELFNKRGRKPWASVNFITAHDGFTLNDLVSYSDKHNEANGEANKDGNLNNLSWNCGAEGPTEDREINKLRERQKRNMLATLFFSQGTPMVLGGDEFGRTQRGNNNAYCQDNEISWVDWEGIKEEGQSLIFFTRKLIRLRHSLPILRRGRFLTAESNPALEVKDVTWINASGKEMQKNDWEEAKMSACSSTETLTLATRAFAAPICLAAASDRSRLRPLTNGPRSLTLTTTERPVERSVKLEPGTPGAKSWMQLSNCAR